MSLADQKLDQKTMLLSMIFDDLQIIGYQQRAIAGSKRNPVPKLLTQQINDARTHSQYESFDSAEDYERARERIMKGG